MTPIRLLYVVNKQLPEGDYRIVYGQQSELCHVVFAMPGKPRNLPKARFVAMNFREGLRPAYLAEFGRLFAYLRRRRSEFDLVHLYSTNLILLGPLVARLAGVPSMITLTGFGRTFTSTQRKYRLLQPIYWALLRVAASLSRAMLFQNHADMQALAARFPTLAERFYYAGSAISMRIVQDKSFTTAPLRVLLVARLMPDKGIEDFLQVAELCYQDGIEFVLVGPPSLGFDALHATVQAYHTRGVITYLGELDARSTHSQLAMAHVFFFPSHGEGMARAMLEAGFALTCPIAYDIAANLDLVSDGKGFLVPFGRSTDVKAILQKLDADRTLLEKQARAYQDHILTHFTMDVFTERMDNLVLRLANQSRNPSKERSTSSTQWQE